MKARIILALTLAVFIAAPAAFAQKEKKATIGNFPFWAAVKGNQKAGQLVPGLNAVLQLTEEQIKQIQTAASDAYGNEEFRTRLAKAKDTNTSAAEREALRAEYEKAEAAMHDRVARVLTAEQQALIAKINATHAEAMGAIRDEFQNRYATVKGDDEARKRLQAEMKEKLDTDFIGRINSFLTPAQRAAREQAAAEEKAAETNSDKKVKK
ncbi:MAG: hypothetical protein HY300_06070 [Verrucomicrobia bacterium]|nr:hypothetical protein [Verrucomicrobiota bacterium]